MRSKLGTKSRLAAHILALVLLIFMLVYTSPDTKTVEEQPRRLKPSVSINPAKPTPDTEKSGIGTLDRVQTPAVATRVEAEQLRPPAEDGSPRTERPAPPAPGIAAQSAGHPTTIDSTASLQPHSEPLRPPETRIAVAEADETPADAPATDAQSDETVITELNAGPDDTSAPDTAPEVAESEAEPPVEAPVDEAQPAPVIDAQPTDAPSTEPDAPAVDDAQPPIPQPDESGALVVAAPDSGALKPVAAATPLPNANLEVLGDGVYWLDPRHDPEKELAAIPELRSLILLAPLPGYHAQEFAHVKTEVIPADPADLTRDAADQFIHLTDDANKPVAIAVLPGTRGAAFFKGAYLLHNRTMSADDVLREITPELDDAGDSRDDIIHRLMRLKD